MPGAMHRMGVYLGLVEDDEYADSRRLRPAPTGPARRDDYAEDAVPARAAHARDAARPVTSHAEVTRYAREYDEPRSVARPTPRSHAGRQPTYQITALHPRTYNEARTIGEHFRKSTPVIMNLSEMDDADAKRLVDFAAGLTFGLHGRIERVTAKVFLLSPHNVTVTAAGQGQDRERVLQPVLTARRGRTGARHTAAWHHVRCRAVVLSAWQCPAAQDAPHG